MMKIILDKKLINKQEFTLNCNEAEYFAESYIYAFGWLFQNKIIFWEDIYFQLMASMRKMKIKIPLFYTPEMFEENILVLAKSLQVMEGAFKITIFKREDENLSFYIEIFSDKKFYTNLAFELDVYKEISMSPTIISALQICHPINRVARQYALENDLNEVILLNNERRVARTIQGNIFFIKEEIIYSNSLSEGAFVSAFKKNFISFLDKKTSYTYKEENISPFQLLSAEEIFIMSDEVGVIPVTTIRKNKFTTYQLDGLVRRFMGYSVTV